MKTAINVLAWMAMTTVFIALLVGVAWTFQHAPWLGCVALVAVFSFLAASLTRWPMK